MTSSTKKYLKNEANLASGKKIIIDPSNSDDSATVQHFVRHYRKESIHIKNESTNESNLLENIRNFIKYNQLKEAENAIEQLDLNYISEELKPEFHLESARLFLFQSQYIKSLEFTAKVICHPLASNLTRVTAHQLNADIYLRLDDLYGAEENALIAVKSSKKFKLLSSRFTSLGFLAVIQNLMNKKLDLEKTIEIFQKEISMIQNIDTWIDRSVYLYRTLYRIHLHNNDLDISYKNLTYAHLFSQVSLNINVLKQCETDLLQFDKKNDIPNQYIKFINHYFWVPELKMIGSTENNKIVRFKENSRRSQILNLIFENQLEFDYIFESIWKMNYNKDKHSNLVRNHLFLINKEWPGLIEKKN